MKTLILIASLAAVLAGCVTTTPATAVHQPMTARPEPRNYTPPTNGAIYNVASARPLFEDRRARFIGDTLTINIAEKTAASKISENKTDRSQTVAASGPSLAGVVNPNNVTSANTVTSTQVADARIEYKANGFLDSAQVMGWLGRFFLTVLPF